MLEQSPHSWQSLEFMRCPSFLKKDHKSNLSNIENLFLVTLLGFGLPVEFKQREGLWRDEEFASVYASSPPTGVNWSFWWEGDQLTIKSRNRKGVGLKVIVKWNRY